jgi:Lipase maturation factor
MPGAADLWIPRLLFQRGLGLVYFIAFLVAVNQFRPLLGEHGLQPVPLFVNRVTFQESPSLFFFAPKDWAFTGAAWLGLALSIVAMAGFTERFGAAVSMVAWAAMWLLYISFVNVGQTFYSFGWETMLLEAGFCAIFLGASAMLPSSIPLWILRWMEFRVMFGAGLIKLRGDPCWRELTCLDYHYETQPIPNPLSWYFHWLPRWALHGGVAFNHFVEIVVPFAFFLPQPFAGLAASITILFQLMLMLSGNLSFLNLLTIVIALPMLDSRWFAKWLPVTAPAALQEPSRWFEFATIGYAAVVVLLSIRPAINLVSSRQLMNASFEPLHLVNTYGAFGSVGRTRDEVIVEGTADPTPSEYADWRAYEFKGKPGDPMRTPPQIAPYHLRLDWQMWFAAMSNYTQEPWFVNFVAKLLQGDRDTLSLLRFNPFPTAPPKYVRARLYRYRFSNGEERRRTGAWWQREFEGEWFPAISLDTPGLRKVLRDQGWK